MITFSTAPLHRARAAHASCLQRRACRHETVQVDLRNGEHLSEAYRQINPHCTVPTLRADESLLLTDNAAISSYLEARYPQPSLLGTTPAEKAETRLHHH
jgi:glutathione S-transferase